jgi:hypothetical protein
MARPIPALTDHASQRALERVTAEGLAVEPLVRLAVAFAARYPKEDIAVRLYHGTAAHGDTTSPLDDRGSNGEDLWTVARQGSIVSFFWRRAAQPVSPDRFEVRKVFMRGWAHA